MVRPLDDEPTDGERVIEELARDARRIEQQCYPDAFLDG
jgi:hypothetical protein